MSYSAVVIGLGQVGMLYDTAGDAGATTLSHAYALARHPMTELVGGVDLSESRMDEFSRTFGSMVSASVEEVVSAQRPDIVVIATPTTTHAETLERVLQVHTPRVVLMEKPISLSGREGAAMVEACRDIGTSLFVNYVRRSYPAYLQVGDLIRDGSFGGPFKGVGWYSGGLLNNGSHIVNLLESWFGGVEAAQVTRESSVIAEDPSPDLWVGFAGCELHLVATPPKGLSIIGAELIGENGRLTVEGFVTACTWQPMIPNPTFPRHMTLSSASREFALDWQRSQWFVVDEMVRYLRSGRGGLCTGEQALATLSSLEFTGSRS